jgi:20S proteasome subunit alpha 3
MTADANYLVDYAREAGQKFRMTLRNPIPVEQLVIKLCDLKQSYTQFGGMRPFGAGFIIAGWDDRHGFQLLSTDPAGNYLKWKAYANGKTIGSWGTSLRISQYANFVGTGEANANSLLIKKYKDDITVEEGIALSIEAICKTLDSSSPDPTKSKCLKLTSSRTRDSHQKYRT